MPINERAEYFTQAEFARGDATRKAAGWYPATVRSQPDIYSGRLGGDSWLEVRRREHRHFRALEWQPICSGIYPECNMPQLADLFRALADTNRLRIMNILSRQSLRVCDLQSILNLPKPFISRHLAYLRKAGLVRCANAGRRVCYSLALGTPFGYALQSFLRDTLPLSSDFQGDLRRLAGMERTEQPKPVAADLDQPRRKAA